MNGARGVPLVLVLAVGTTLPASSQQVVGMAGTRVAQPTTDLCRTGRVAGFGLRTGQWVDGIELRCRLPDGNIATAPYRGGNGGAPVSFVLEPGDEIRRVTGFYQGPYIYGIQFHTASRSTPIFGQVGDQRFQLEVPAGQILLGFQFHAGEFLHGLSLVVQPAGAVAPSPSPVSAPAPARESGSPPPAVDSRAPVGLQPVTPPYRFGPDEACPVREAGCSDPNGMGWVAARMGVPLPANLDLGSRSERVCRAWLGAPGVPAQPLIGAARIDGANGCVVVLNSRVLYATEFEVLYSVTNYSGRLTEADYRRLLVPMRRGEPLPSNVLMAAMFHGEVQAICLYNDGATVYLGRASNSTGGCLVVWGNPLLYHGALVVTR